MRYIREEQSGDTDLSGGGIASWTPACSCPSIDPLAALGSVSVSVCVYVYVCRVRYAVSPVETRIRAAAQHGMHRRLWLQPSASTRHASAQQPEASAGHRDAHFGRHRPSPRCQDHRPRQQSPCYHPSIPPTIPTASACSFSLHAYFIGSTGLGGHSCASKRLQASAGTTAAQREKRSSQASFLAISPAMRA